MTAPTAGDGLLLPDGVDQLRPAALPDDARVAVVAADYHAEIVGALLEAAVAHLEAAGVARDRITVATAPGAFELPFVAQQLAATGRYAAVVTLGCVIRGGTPHF
jgi:6,7-dimethyl-8-ribityllumazine synthase